MQDKTKTITAKDVLLVSMIPCMTVAWVILIVVLSYPCEECDAHYYMCHDFSKHVDGLSFNMCMDYLETNPDSTERQMLNHYSIPTLDYILDGPVVSVDGRELGLLCRTLHCR